MIYIARDKLNGKDTEPFSVRHAYVSAPITFSGERHPWLLQRFQAAFSSGGWIAATDVCDVPLVGPGDAARPPGCTGASVIVHEGLLTTPPAASNGTRRLALIEKGFTEVAG